MSLDALIRVSWAENWETFRLSWGSMMIYG
jgi:hypothetical protein